ncbi:thermonuclease family protein [Dickeya dadantii]|uniref:thermonuclease family protein n=1 Tax=Dickeya dadantii TaxID=204038 RepID=UPI0014955CF6|nr:thermonuclease family protein [Dickeya dadantii]NPE55911.1 thermonuclease family protein [Dickeya dadantii]NPE67135.1 thermonuclease family protein [Dickeya dadantii]
MKSPLLKSIFLFSASLVFSVHAYSLFPVFHSQTVAHGKTNRVIDGDTFVLVNEKGEEKKIRLACIDAPEKDQYFGIYAKNYLNDKLAGKDNIVVNIIDIDKYGRYIAFVGDDGNVNKDMVRNGYAWVYRQYCHDPSYLNLEVDAKKKKIGLWENDNPIPPWEWRHEKKG